MGLYGLQRQKGKAFHGNRPLSLPQDMDMLGQTIAIESEEGKGTRVLLGISGTDLILNNSNKQVQRGGVFRFGPVLFMVKHSLEKAFLYSLASARSSYNKFRKIVPAKPSDTDFQYGHVGIPSAGIRQHEIGPSIFAFIIYLFKDIPAMELNICDRYLSL